jgi:GNAT superfamily N-acetyltransferase
VSLAIRPAVAADVPEIVAMIRELATYEREPDAVEATEDLIAAALFGPSPAAFCHIAVDGGSTMGFALWFLNFSTWLGRHGIYLEDLYVRPEARGSGAGRALLAELARICVERGYRRLEWSVLDWNVDAHGFYRRFGAAPMDEWTVWRLTGDRLAELGGRGT